MIFDDYIKLYLHLLNVSTSHYMIYILFFVLPNSKYSGCIILRLASLDYTLYRRIHGRIRSCLWRNWSCFLEFTGKGDFIMATFTSGGSTSVVPRLQMHPTGMFPLTSLQSIYLIARSKTPNPSSLLLVCLQCSKPGPSSSCRCTSRSVPRRDGDLICSIPSQQYHLHSHCSSPSLWNCRRRCSQQNYTETAGTPPVQVSFTKRGNPSHEEYRLPL